MNCEYCKKPLKEIKRKVLGQTITTYVKCDCRLKKAEQEEKKYKEQDNFMKVKQMQDLCFDDTIYKKWCWEADNNKNEQMSNTLKRYTPSNKKIKKGLLFYGEKGVGKTFYACCIANNFIENGKSAFFTSVTEYANADFETKAFIEERLKKSYLVVIDDFLLERDTAFMQEQMFYILNLRYSTGKLTIFTTNLTLEQLKNPVNVYEERLYSRLFEMATFLELKGKDQRVEKLKKSRA